MFYLLLLISTVIQLLTNDIIIHIMYDYVLLYNHSSSHFSYHHIGYDYDDLDMVCGLARGNSGWGAPHSFLPPAIRYGIHMYYVILYLVTI